MKEITRTDQGTYIVEISRDEWIALTRLSQVLKGEWTPGLGIEMFRGDIELECDLQAGLEAVGDWVSVKRRLNGLQDCIDTMNKKLGDVGEK